MIAAPIVRVRNTRLGLKMSGKRGSNEAAWGWALIGRPRPALRYAVKGDPLALALKAAREWDDRQDGPFTLYTYLSDDAFARSIAAGEGMTREQHLVHVNTIAARLAEAGIAVTICEIE